MKILHLVTKRQYRGAEIFAANLSEELIKFGHTIIFAGLYQNDTDILSVENAKNIDLSHSKSSIFSPFLVLKISNLIKEEKPDIIQCNGSDTLKYMYFASYLIPNNPPIIYRNISMISKWMIGNRKRIFYQNIFNMISHVSSVGDETLKDFLRVFNYPRTKISVIRRGIPIFEIDKAIARKKVLKEFNLKPGDKLVVHMGNFSPEKNHSFLIDIFKRMKDNQPNIKLICVGGGVLFDEIKQEVIDQNLEETVYLPGFKKNVSEILAAADCLALCSIVEGVPGAILEAAVQKTPSISTNVGGVNEVLKNDCSGFVVNDFDKEEYYKKLVILVSNSELNMEMGEKAYKVVMNEFGTESNARNFEQLYISLVNEL